MKINSVNLKIALVFGVATILAIFITRPVYSQETAKKESHKKIVLKIVSDDNGKTTLIDTTMEIPDSAMMDSLRKEIDKVIVLGEGGKHARFKIHNMPQGFAYDFDMPPPPECPKELEELEGFDWEGMVPDCDMADRIRERTPGRDRRIMRSGGHEQTLNDILGEIPMDRVVSYSIKDRKNGKRIIIDLNDAPMFEKQDRVIIIREPGRLQHQKTHPGHQVKVYMNSEDDVKLDNSPKPPPPPSAPVPPVIPDKTSPKKPKI